MNILTYLNIDYWNARYLLAGLNFGLCTALGIIALCRISVVSAATTKKGTRYAYAGIMFTASGSAISPWLDAWPGWTTILSNGAFLLLLWSGRHAWKNGQLPEFAKSDETPLDQLPPENRT